MRRGWQVAGVGISYTFRFAVGRILTYDVDNNGVLRLARILRVILKGLKQPVFVVLV